MNENFMKEKPILPLILSMSLPMVISMLVNSLYNIVDSFFVAQISENAMTALSLVYPVQNFINAVGIGFGVGINAVIAYYLGAGDEKKASAAASHGTLLSVIHGVILTAVCIGIMPSFLRLFTSSEEVVSMGIRYSTVAFAFSLVIMLSLSFEKIFQAIGWMKTTMAALLGGCITNIILDPLFIFVFDWGISGAAIATALSQIIAWAILISYYVRKKTEVRISFRLMYRSFGEYKLLFQTGFPSLCRHGCNMFANIVLNWVAGGWGDAAIAAMSVSSRLLYLSNAVSLGLIEGCQPVIGYAHGMKNYKRVKDAFWFTAKTAMLSMCAFAVVGILFAPGLIGLFRDDADVIRIGATALRLICVALPFSAFMSCVSTLFQVVGRTLPSSLLVFCRQIVFYVPALIALPRLLGLLGLQSAGPVSDLLVFAVALPMVLHYFRQTDAAGENLKNSGNGKNA